MAASRMGAAPSLTGGPSRQANKAAVSGPAMPKRSPGKPGKTIKAQPPSTSMSGPKAKGKAKPKLLRGNVSNSPGKGRGAIKATDMGIGAI